MEFDKVDDPSRGNETIWLHCFALPQRKVEHGRIQPDNRMTTVKIWTVRKCDVLNRNEVLWMF